MNIRIRRSLLIYLFIAACGASTAAFALPTNVTITPPNGARFLPGQRFDLRVEGKGAGPFSATIFIDGAQKQFTSGAQNTVTTDGITSLGWGGFNLRGYTSEIVGLHRIRATFTDATGTVTVTAQFEIVHPLWTDRFTRQLEKGQDRNQSAEQTQEAAPAPGRRAAASRQAEAALDLPALSQEGIKNVIIMVGDGMGVAHRTAARLVRHGVTGGSSNGYLAMDAFPGTGLLTTHSLNSIVTDSAPGMACYTTGNHFNNNQEGVFPANVTNPFFAPRVEYLAEYLHRTLGRSSGIVTTADVEDATPASNAAHTLLRSNGTGIVDQYLDESDAANTGKFGTGLKVLLGGGRRWFVPSGQFGSSRSASNDYPAMPTDLAAAWGLPAGSRGAADPTRDLIQDYKNAGFTYADSLSALNAAGTPDKLLGLFAWGNMNTSTDKIAKRRNQALPGQTSFVVDDYRAPDQPMLEEMTAAALRVLSKNQNGFVLMVEAAHIDKQSHSMDSERAIWETLEFDNAVAVARNFADVNGDTLVLVLADHECAGFSILGALSGKIDTLKNMASDAAKLDPATQPERQKMIGVYEAAGFPKYTIAADGYPQTLDVDGKILIGYGASGDRYETWVTNPLPSPSVDSLPSSISGELATKGYPTLPVDRAKEMGYYLRGQAGGRTFAVHTASDIPVSAYSTSRTGREPWRSFGGVQENTDIFFKIMRAILGGY
ncbi:MAG: alkaline phosphatase [Blastocatellia bacterium]|nr:alkaline phosphatase [Blastocatellia bacterium]